DTARYICCYDIQTQTPVSARLLGSDEQETTADETTRETTSQSGDTTIPVGTYLGFSTIPPKLLEVSNLVVEEDEIFLIVEEDGTAHGEKKLSYSYTALGIDDAPVYISDEWTVVIDGMLTDSQGELILTLNYHFVSKGPGTDDPQDRMAIVEGIYEITVSGDTLSAVPKVEDLDMDKDTDVLSFEVTKE
ncbi:MAG: hypothetical protein JXA42_22300, partial [Anaerolineales bacterium]|nr:hypothetical protein [Anaerolineales bacterium]